MEWLAVLQFDPPMRAHGGLQCFDKLLGGESLCVLTLSFEQRSAVLTSRLAFDESALVLGLTFGTGERRSLCLIALARC